MRLKEQFVEEFLGSARVLTFGLLVNGVLNYFFQIVIARGLSVQEFGKISTLLAVLNLLGLLSISIRIFSVDVYTRFDSLELSRKKVELPKVIGVVSASVSGIIFAGLFAFELLAFPASNAFFVFALWLAPSALWMLYVGRLQSQKMFGSIVLLNVLLSCIKLFHVAILLKFTQISINLIISLFPWFIVVIIIAGVLSKDIKQKTTRPSSKRLLRISLVYAGLSFFIYADLFFVRHFASPIDAGIFAAACVVGKSVFLVSTIFTEIVFPTLIKRSNLDNDTSQRFKGTFVLQLIAALISAVIVSVLGNRAILIAFGQSYVGGTYLVVSICLGSIGASVVYLIAHKSIAIEDWSVIPALFISVAFISLAILKLPYETSQVGVVFFAGSILFFIASKIFQHLRRENLPTLERTLNIGDGH